MRARFFCTAAIAALALLAGCHEDEDEETNDDYQRVLPTLGSAFIVTNGGQAAGLAGRSAGDAGNILANSFGGELAADDGRARATITSNFLTTAETDGGVVTWAELVALSAPAIAAGTATFTVATDFWLTSGITINLSDAPYTGSAPATDVVDVVFNCTGAVRLDGAIVTTRTGNDAVGLTFATTDADGISLDGSINTNAAATFDAGSVGLTTATNGGPVIVGGTISAVGGNADATTDAGDGGDAGFSADGDLVLRLGTLYAVGQAGHAAGGDGGNVTLTAQYTVALDYRWSIAASGGNGGTGAGGSAGIVALTLGTQVDFYATIQGWGGSSTGGNGGLATAISVFAGTVTGTLTISADGGDAATATGMDGGSCTLTCGQIADFYARLDAIGGTGSTAGFGGNLIASVTAGLAGVLAEALVDGGTGSTTGGNGGMLMVQGNAPGVLLDDVALWGWARGGQGPTAGSGGVVRVTGAAAAAVYANDLLLHGEVNGGMGGIGGTGGTVLFSTTLGGGNVELEGSADGGLSNAVAGGAGGLFEATATQGSLAASLSATARGGQGVTVAGGTGGILRVDSSYTTTTGGNCEVWGTFSGLGGDSDVAGGLGGVISLGCGSVGALVADRFTGSVRGGDSQTANGGNGGSVLTSADGPMQFAGSLDTSGGNGSTVSGTGNGGSAGNLTLSTAQGTILMAATLRANGGTGAAAGGAGGNITISSDADGLSDAGNVLCSGRVHSLGGDAGTGAGGNGGAVVINGRAAAGGGYDGEVTVTGEVRVTGGSSASGTGGTGGTISAYTESAQMTVTSLLQANGGAGSGDGGTITLGDNVNGNPSALVVAASAQLIANGATNAAGLAGFINLNPAGVGPNNPLLLVQAGATVSTDDGAGADQSGTNLWQD